MTTNGVCCSVLLCLLLPTSAFSVSPEGLVGYWPLDEGRGDVAEELSGKSQAGRLLGQATWEDTQRGVALRFNGTNTAVRIPDSPAWNIGRGEMTLCVWIKTDQQANGCIMDHDFAKIPGAWVLQVGTPPLFSFYDDEPRGQGIRFEGFKAGTWQHLALVWRRAPSAPVAEPAVGVDNADRSGPGDGLLTGLIDEIASEDNPDETGGWIRTYVNGEPAAFRTVAGTARRLGDLYLGARQGSDLPFAGHMKDVLMFDRALSHEEIQGIYSRGVALQSPVMVSMLRASKVLYGPNEKGHVSLRLRNTSGTNQTLTLVLQCVSMLDDTREVHREQILLERDAATTREIEFDFVNETYGCELRAVIEQKGKILSTKSETFSVADNLWKVCLGGADLISQTAPASEDRIKEAIGKARQSYCNWFEKFFWAPDDWGDLTTEPGATWFSGQTRRHESTDKLKLMIDTAHEHGMRAITYGKCMAGGVSGWEMARRRPEWFMVDIYGRTMGRPTTVWDLDHWHEADKYEYSDFSYAWTYRWVDLRRMDALDHGIDELIGSTRQFGWDGVRFDSGGFRAHFVDGEYNGHDAVNTRNMKRLKERIWKVYPDYVLGYNTDNPKSKDGREYPLDPADPIAHEMREMLAGGGLWMGEAMNDWNNGSVHYTSWSQFARDSVRYTRTIREYGGHFCYSYGLGDDGKAADLYKFVIGTMTGAHQYGLSHIEAGGSEHWGRFLTRWSALVWHHNLDPLENPEALLAVKSERPLWWNEFANELVIEPRRRLVIVNLLNPPLNDQIAATRDMLPDAVDDCILTLNIPRGQKLQKVFFVSPGSPNRSQGLKAVEKGASAQVSVPEFDVWAMVVYELIGKFTIPKPAPKFTEPLSAAERAELKRTTPRPMDKTPGFGNVPPASIPTIAVADNILNPAHQHDDALKTREFGEPKARLPEGLAVGGAAGLDLLIVKGFYHQAYQVPRAVTAVAPDARVTECTSRDLPKDYKDIFRFDVIVLADMGADAWDANGHKRLADYAKAGGRLVVLGGPFTLGQGFFKCTALESVLPIHVRPGRDIYKLSPPLVLGPQKSASFRGDPLLYYYHAVEPKPDADVGLWAGNLPVLFEQQVGKGSVAAFIGTVLGEARQETQTPFWEWDNWPPTFGILIVGKKHAPWSAQIRKTARGNGEGR